MLKTSQFRTLFFILSVGVIFSACSPSQKLRRAQKLIASAEADGATWHIDTTFQTIHDTIPIFKIDTVINTKLRIDTVLLSDGGKITIERDTVTHTERIQVQGPTVVRTIRVPYTVIKTISAPKDNKVAPGWRTTALITGFLLALIFGVLIYRIVR